MKRSTNEKKTNEHENKKNCKTTAIEMESLAAVTGTVKMTIPDAGTVKFRVT